MLLKPVIHESHELAGMPRCCPRPAGVRAAGPQPVRSRSAPVRVAGFARRSAAHFGHAAAGPRARRRSALCLVEDGCLVEDLCFVEDGCVAECVFCEIASGRRQAHVVLDDPRAIAFLDARPVFKGHVLLIPRVHRPTFADLPRGCLEPFFAQAQRLATAMEEGLGAAGSFVAMNNRISQSVPHLHVHIVPRNRKDGLRGFFWPRTKYASEREAGDYADRLRAALKDQ